MSEASGAPASEADMRGVQNARRALDHIEQSLGPLLELDRKQVVSSLTPLENAELNLALAYAVDSLFYVWLRSKNRATEDHPVKTELGKVKLYMDKVKKAKAALDEDRGAADDDREDKRALRVDTAAGRRLIIAALAGQLPAGAAPAHSRDAEDDGDGDARSGKRARR